MNSSQGLTISAIAASAPRPYHRAADFPPIARCIRAWRRAYNKEFDASQNDGEAEKKAEKAFRSAMPVLCSRQNISAFIACLVYAMLTQKLRDREADQLMEAANLAIANFRHRA